MTLTNQLFNNGIQPECNSLKVWEISFDVSKPKNTINISGIACELLSTEDGCSVTVVLAEHKHKVIDVFEDEVFIYSSSSRFPIYFRVFNNILKLSNVIYKLFDKNEVVTIDSFVMCQQLLSNFSNDNMFKQIELLEYNARYKISNGKVLYLESTLRFERNASLDDCVNELIKDFEKIFSLGQPISVLLSGGYDSRLNLAISLEMAKKYGNEISLWHEYKNEQEFIYTKNIADNIGLPLNVKTREDFSKCLNKVIFDIDYIKENYGVYRTNIPRWLCYLNYIKMANMGSTILGHGAEGHKGKFYNQIKNINNVSDIFGVDPICVSHVASSLGLKITDDSQTVLFNKLIEHAQIYPDLSSQIDFIHYHTYVANGYGRRSHTMSQYFDIPFPFLGEKFLSLVFSLPKKDKEGFKLVTGLIKTLCPEFLSMPFTSANMKSLKNRTARQSIMRMQTFGGLRKMKMKYFSKKNIIDQISDVQINAFNKFDYVPRSEITLTLKNILINDADIPYMRYSHVLQLYLFLVVCEEEKNVTFKCE